ncbi:RsmB/NOP family class I SAM-dependent RNA methyltransferase [Trichothermofontia sp.]
MTHSRLIDKLARSLFTDGAEQAQWLAALRHPQPVPSAIAWCQPRPEPLPFIIEPPLDWQPAFVDRVAAESRPGQHPLHTQGAYYCLDFSSVFAAYPVLTVPQPVDTLIDVCAAPGGKSILAAVGLRPQVLISNETIGKRLGMLISNLKRCQIQAAIVTHRDSQILAQALPATADVVMVDAPCTGQSLLAKGEAAPGCFHPITINKNANRQKRILANAAQLVKPGGYLAYMTCAYSPAENEQVCDWLLARFPQFHPCVVPALAPFQSHLTTLPCYRLFPQSGLGAGGFTALFQHQGTGETHPITTVALRTIGVCWQGLGTRVTPPLGLGGQSECRV